MTGTSVKDPVRSENKHLELLCAGMVGTFVSRMTRFIQLNFRTLFVRSETKTVAT